MNIEEILEQLKNPTNLEDINWLANAVVELSSQLYWHNTKTAQAELAENQVAVELLDLPLTEGEKKLSVAEADKKAVVSTDNEYGKLKLQSEAIIETIQAIKKKIDTLSYERRTG